MLGTLPNIFKRFKSMTAMRPRAGTLCRTVRARAAAQRPLGEFQTGKCHKDSPPFCPPVDCFHRNLGQATVSEKMISVTGFEDTRVLACTKAVKLLTGCLPFTSRYNVAQFLFITLDGHVESGRLERFTCAAPSKKRPFCPERRQSCRRGFPVRSVRLADGRP